MKQKDLMLKLDAKFKQSTALIKEEKDAECDEKLAGLKTTTPNCA